MSILAVHGGAAYHIESLESARYSHFFDEVVRPEGLGRVKLERHDTIIVPCRTPAYRMAPHARRLRDYLDAGGTVVAMGECHSELWLPGIRFSPCETNFWWWLEPGADLGVRIARPGHPLFSRLRQTDLAWHLHGFFDAPEGAEVLVTGPGERPILYVDEVTTPGRMVVTSLDPFFHNGHRFMPATTRFLDGFLPWVAELRRNEGKDQ